MPKFTRKQRNGSADQVFSFNPPLFCIFRPFLNSISDFGLSRSGDEYLLSTDSKIPIRWTAIEVLMEKPATSASDVWSFGIVCWEILMNGAKPYAEHAPAVLLNVLREGARLPQPENCPDDLWMMMSKCWNVDPLRRPTFKEVKVRKMKIRF